MMMWMRLGAGFPTSLPLPERFYYYLHLAVLLYARFSKLKKHQYQMPRCCKVSCFLASSMNILWPLLFPNAALILLLIWKP